MSKKKFTHNVCDVVNAAVLPLFVILVSIWMGDGAQSLLGSGGGNSFLAFHLVAIFAISYALLPRLRWSLALLIFAGFGFFSKLLDTQLLGGSSLGYLTYGSMGLLGAAFCISFRQKFQLAFVPKIKVRGWVIFVLLFVIDAACYFLKWSHSPNASALLNSCLIALAVGSVGTLIVWGIVHYPVLLKDNALSALLKKLFYRGVVVEKAVQIENVMPVEKGPEKVGKKSAPPSKETGKLVSQSDAHWQGEHPAKKSDASSEDDGNWLNKHLNLIK
jgi:hypothetical protein